MKKILSIGLSLLMLGSLAQGSNILNNPFPFPFSMENFKHNQNQWLPLNNEDSVLIKYQLLSNDSKEFIKYKIKSVHSNDFNKQGIAIWTGNAFCDYSSIPKLCIGATEDQILLKIDKIH